jgi:5'-methylthioadenosine/S-adenosylhomocysteine nucleosidase
MVINIGVSGSVDNRLDIGDIVVGEKLVQHDFDVTGFGRKLGEIEGIGIYIETNSKLLDVFKNKDVKIGVIASGDKFVTDISDKNFIREEFKALCVEMEGASVAQVCLINKIDFLIIRSISDKLDGSSKIEFPKFLVSSSKKAANLLYDVIGEL